jgi:hypothetical protein
MMTNLCMSVWPARSRTISRCCSRAIQLAIAGILISPIAAAAQGSGRPEIRVGLGTFLSRDRGWNYEEPVEFFASIARKAGSMDVEAAASFSKSFASFSSPAVVGSESNYRDGFRIRLGLRAPSATRSMVSALVGAEFVHNNDERTVRRSTMAGTAGLGVNFGPERRGTIDLRYVAFANRLGTSRGVLPLTFAWRL